jgi:diphthamide biosynthesis methyltransferase
MVVAILVVGDGMVLFPHVVLTCRCDRNGMVLSS